MGGGNSVMEQLNVLEEKMMDDISAGRRRKEEALEFLENIRLRLDRNVANRDVAAIWRICSLEERISNIVPQDGFGVTGDVDGSIRQDAGI